jgi:hypothetical protein
MRLPHQMLVETRLESHALRDPGAETRSRVDAGLAGRDWAGRRVAVAVGSRGIDRIVSVVRAVVEALKARGARPFLLPAMGSHGGATAPGQVEVLEALGITEEAVGAPVVSSLETADLGEAPLGFRVRASRDALGADALVPVNRVEPHTDFSSPSLGSGLLKMIAIGLGKPEGAFECHRAASRYGHEAVIRQASPLVLAKLPPVLGVALVEDARHQLARVEVIDGKDLEAREPELLRQARAWMPALPLSEIDVLILDEIGKNVSGAGMDTNIVGRGVDGLPRTDRRSAVRILYVRGLTPESHGNAVGMGLADVVSSRLVASVDTRSTYMNSLSAMTPAMARAPMHFESDALCLEAAFRMAGVDVDTARVVRVRNTLALDRFVASAACAPAITGRDDLRVIVPPREWRLGAGGDLDPADDLLSEAAPA